MLKSPYSQVPTKDYTYDAIFAAILFTAFLVVIIGLVSKQYDKQCTTQTIVLKGRKVVVSVEGEVLDARWANE